VPGSRCKNEIKRLAGKRPVLKGCCDDFYLRKRSEPSSGYVGKSGSKFQCHDPITPIGQRSSRLASAGADLKDTRIRRQSSNQLKVIKEFRRIAGSDPVVELWYLIEGGSSLRCAHVLHLLQHQMSCS
jgi:hypothetical protein